VSGTALFAFDLLVTGLICVAYTQAARLVRRLLGRGGSDASDGHTPWRYSPFRPGGGPHARGDRRRPPQRDDRTGRPAHRSPPVT
jgi:hypothetical protein